jgi:two-component system, cell cycle sensor histidine kinase and response regulator CckA
MRIALIVDDHEENLYLLRSVLESCGYDVVSARHGQEALDAGLARVPDLIVSDILMPVMDGFTFCRRCRELEALSRVPFVFYTATYTNEDDERLALGLGADLFLVKPLEPDVLMARISEVLARRAAGATQPAAASPLEETAYLKQYNQALIRKLEDKVADVEDANRALRIKDDAIESAPAGVVFVSLDHRISYANSAMAALVGRRRHELVGSPLCDLFASADEWVAAYRGIVGEGRWSGELTALATAGLLVVNLTAHTVIDHDGRPLCRMAVFEDITERRRMAEEVQRQQRLASLSLFAAGVAHDFNNLLTGVFGNIELAIADLPADHPARERLQFAGVAFGRARDLTRRLLTFAKGSPPARRSLAATDLMRECCALALAGSNVAVDLVSAPDLWPVAGDANQLSQVFTNILVNAREAMPDGGAVHVHLHNVDLQPPLAQSIDLGPGPYVRISVRDEGPGIAADVLPRLFGPLFSTKPDGNGLGLAMCYSIVRAHGGRIDVRSRPGGGATFEVVVPAGASDDACPESPIATLAPSARSARILVMDDEALIREVAAKMLERGGYEVVTAPDGSEALEIWAGAMRAGSPFDVVILDVTVPGAMGGREALARLRRSGQDLAVVLSTGHGAEDAGESGCLPDAVLPKPYQLHELLACVHAALGAHVRRA